MCDEYNGWTNHPTWLVALWLSNEQRSYHHARELAIACRRVAPYHWLVQESVWTVEDAARIVLADEVRDWIEGDRPLADDASLYTDLMGWVLATVNWQEIADNILSELEEDDE